MYMWCQSTVQKVPIFRMKWTRIRGETLRFAGFRVPRLGRPCVCVDIPRLVHRVDDSCPVFGYLYEAGCKIPEMKGT